MGSLLLRCGCLAELLRFRHSEDKVTRTETNCKMADEVAGSKLFVVLSVAGLVSGFLTCILMYRHTEAPIFSGVVFALFLTVPLAISGILDSYFKALILMAVTTAAYSVAAFVAIGIQMSNPQIILPSEVGRELASPTALFDGGLAGGFLVFGAVVLLCRTGISMRTLFLRVFLGTILGGLLGVVGWALSASVGVTTWHLLHALHIAGVDDGQTSRMYSVYLVWQTGVAMAVGIMLWGTPVRVVEMMEFFGVRDL